MEVDHCIDFLLKNKHAIEMLLLKNNKTFEECLTSQSPFDNKIFMVEYTDVNDILYDDSYENGTYGFLNYQMDLKYDKLFNRNYSFYNKPSIVKKLLNSDKTDLSEDAKEQYYGVLELFEKSDNNIINLEKYYLIKGGNINYVNNTDYKKIVIKDLQSDFEITKIYKIDTKINLITIVSKDEYIIDNNCNEPFIKYEKLIKQNCSNNKRLMNYLLNFDSIYRLFKMLDTNSNSIDLFDLNDVLEYDFSSIVTNIKVSNKYCKEEYDSLIEKYFGLTLNELFKDLLEKYNINDKIKQSIKLILEILIRLYIDIKLGNNKFNLSKTICQYIPTDIDGDLYSHLKSQILIDRHWRNLLGYDEITIDLNEFNIKP
jgi:hypothetical protein